jgi:hypothetical protein
VYRNGERERRGKALTTGRGERRVAVGREKEGKNKGKGKGKK